MVEAIKEKSFKPSVAAIAEAIANTKLQTIVAAIKAKAVAGAFTNDKHIAGITPIA